MLKQFLNHIEQNNLCKKADTILLAVSGGLDSMVMLHLFVQAKIAVGVAHCNFQLRGDESSSDEQFVRETCEKHSLPFFCHRFETKLYAEENRLSIQMAARELRYSWFEDLLESDKCNQLATAHHLNDSIETILLNWIHGQSIDGWSGIPVKNKKIIRPLLFATRKEIEHYATENQIAWREDSSNITSDYQRNFIRHKVIPLLKEINPSLEPTIERSISKLKGELEILDYGFEHWKKKYVVQTPEKTVIEKEALAEFGNAASSLWRLINHLGFNYDVCISAIEALNGQPGKKFIGPAHTLIIDRENLIVSPKIDFWNEVAISQNADNAFLGSWKLEILDSKVRKSESVNEAVLDADKIQFPLQWRQWKAGDVFFPLGMEHRKKVSDLLIDEKVSLADKSLVTVLESDGQIIWVVGHRIDNRYKITDQTQRAIVFTVSPYFV